MVTTAANIVTISKYCHKVHSDNKVHVVDVIDKLYMKKNIQN